MTTQPSELVSRGVERPDERQRPGWRPPGADRSRKGAGAANFTPNGEVVYSPDVTSVEGTVGDVLVEDDYRAEATGVARIRVRQADSNEKPEARNDVGRTTVGRPVVLNVLDNDVDPDGDPFFAQNLQSIDGPSPQRS